MAPARSYHADPESPMGRAVVPDERLYAEEIANIRLRDPLELVLRRLAEAGFELNSLPDLREVQYTPIGQLIAFRKRQDAPGPPFLRPSEMLTLGFCYGTVRSMNLITPLADGELEQYQADDTAHRPYLRVESISDTREVRRYGTNSLSGIHIVYWRKTKQSRYFPNERVFLVQDANWCVIEDSRRRQQLRR
jgi:hypothetical protein